MKRMKKIVSMLLAVIMVLGMSLTVIAADNDSHKITVTQNENDKTEHTYEAYQIFAGDLAEKEGKKVLSNIIWGSGVNGDALLTALKADPAFKVENLVCKNTEEEHEHTNACYNLFGLRAMGAL